MGFSRPDQRAADPCASIPGIDNQPGQPWRETMRRFKFVPDQQARANRHIADSGHECRLEAITGKQSVKACRILFDSPCRPLEKGGEAQSRDGC